MGEVQSLNQFAKILKLLQAVRAVLQVLAGAVRKRCVLQQVVEKVVFCVFTSEIHHGLPHSTLGFPGFAVRPLHGGRSDQEVLTGGLTGILTVPLKQGFQLTLQICLLVLQVCHLSSLLFQSGFQQ